MRGRRVITGRVAALVATGVVALGTQHAAGAAGPIKDEGGPARVVKPVTSGNETGDFLTGGTGTTLWTLALPAQAKCSGDTATNSFHTFTYVVPAAVDPGGMHFGAEGPDTAEAHPIFDDGGGPVIAVNTAPVTGQVLPVPYFTLEWGGDLTPFDSMSLPPGTYNIGIACGTAQGVVDKFWNVQETFVGDPKIATGAGAFAWTVLAAI